MSFVTQPTGESQDAAWPPDLRLERAAVDRLFPFFLQVDDSFRIVRAGRTLRRLLPGLESGPCLSEAFTIERPKSVRGFQSLLAADGGDRINLHEPPEPPSSGLGEAELLYQETLDV